MPACLACLDLPATATTATATTADNLQEGEQATFEACLELRRAKGGEQEAVLTESGLHWALLSQPQAQAPFQPSHFTVSRWAAAFQELPLLVFVAASTGLGLAAALYTCPPGS